MQYTFASTDVMNLKNTLGTLYIFQFLVVSFGYNAIYTELSINAENLHQHTLFLYSVSKQFCHLFPEAIELKHQYEYVGVAVTKVHLQNDRQHPI